MREACDTCLRRAWLLARVAGHLQREARRVQDALALPDAELIEAVGGRHRTEIHDELERFDPGPLRDRIVAAALGSICRCDERYPERLRTLEAAPAALFVAGDLERLLEFAAGEPVAVVGARRASSYGLEVARSLGRGLAAAGVCVVSGMASGVDSAAHAGALAGGGPTLAVLPGPAERPYPAAKRELYRQIREGAAVVSELPPGAAAWRWTFVARNRIIAGLSAMTVVVEAGLRSGSLVTARIARTLGRAVGAVPGQVTAPLAEGPNLLLAGGAELVRHPQDVLDHLFGAGVRSASVDERPALEPQLRSLLHAIASGADTAAALHRAGLPAGDGLAALASLEIAGYIVRGAGGKFVAMP
jgi:DNA processing protein